MPRDLGIPDRIRDAGLEPLEVAHWQTSGSSLFDPIGSMDHHTAGSPKGPWPSLGICANGRAGIPPRLCNVLVGRNNVCLVLASGRANHAGVGRWGRYTDGNGRFYGVERENVGTTAEPWTDEQTEVAARLHAALIGDKGNPDNVIRHAEWAPRRKIDTHSLSGDLLRDKVRYYLGGPILPGPLNPPKEELVPPVISRPQGGAIVVQPDGGVFNINDSPYFGSLPEQGLVPAHPIVGAAWTPSGEGYWLVGRDGGIFAFGDAPAIDPSSSVFPHLGARKVVGLMAISDRAVDVIAFDPSGDENPYDAYRAEG